jgi:hypothetical protein
MQSTAARISGRAGSLAGKRRSDLQHVVVCAGQQLLADAAPLLGDARDLLALALEAEVPAGPLALERADQSAAGALHVEGAADREELLLEAAEQLSRAVLHLDGGEEERDTARHLERELAGAVAHLHRERRHALVLGEAEDLGQQAELRLAAAEHLLLGDRIEDVVVAGGLEQADVLLHQEGVAEGCERCGHGYLVARSGFTRRIGDTRL